MVAVETSTPPRPAVRIEKISEGPITCLRLTGTIDERLGGRRLASAIRARHLVLDLGGVDAISSFGVREWQTFITAVEPRVEQLLLIHCPPRVVHQLNMVSGFCGRGLVLSLYAPYACDDCASEQLLLLDLERDHSAIARLAAPERPCPSCGRPARLVEPPVSYFAALAPRPLPEVDANVAAFLVSRLAHPSGRAAARVDAEKRVVGRTTEVRIVGDLDAAFPGERIAEGLEGNVVLDVSGIGRIDPAGVARFRRFLAAMTPAIDRLHLVGCRPAFLLGALFPEDFGTKVQVVTFALPYTCRACGTNATGWIDLASSHAVLRLAMAPLIRCEACGGETLCIASAEVLTRLADIPRPEVDRATARFIARRRRARGRDVLAGLLPHAGHLARRARRLAPHLPSALAALAALVALAALAASGAGLGARGAAQAAGTPRPSWITSTTPASGYCTDLSNRIVCVGVSSPRPHREAARTEATHAALEALANTIALRIDAAVFRDHVRPLYADLRQLALADIDATSDDIQREGYERALQVVRRARMRVATALERTGGDAVPPQIGDWYWEEQESPAGREPDYLVFVRYDVSDAQASALVDRYGTPLEVLGAQVLTAFPSLGWRFSDVSEGADIVRLEKGSPLRQLGLEERDLVLAIGGERVRDAAAFQERVTALVPGAKRDAARVKFLVERGKGTPIEVGPAATGGEARATPAPP